jgi:16S rRNA (guanine527-N7)-methyltransferase
MPDQGKLAEYASLVRSWADRLDLVAPGDLAAFEKRHIEDSLRLLPLVTGAPPGECADVGSGAGLPGIPLAIASGRPWRLLEPRVRRAGFLEEVVRELELDCEVAMITAEQAAADPRLMAAHQVVTARALAPPGRAFELLLPLVAPGGSAAVFHGPGADLPRDAEEWAPGIATIAGEPLPPTDGTV